MGTGYALAVRVIARKTLRLFWERPGHGDAEQPLKAWFAEARRASWTTPADIKEQYRTASILKGGRAVFNIGGNKYRLVVAVRYEAQIVFIRFVGTHSGYDRINAEEV